MDADIQQAIQIIDAKIASLQEARDRLASAFGIKDQPSHEAFSIRGAASAKNVVPTPPSGNPSPPPMGRKEQLAKYLLEHGPMSRVSIVEHAGLPEGTISYCLNDKRFFEQLEDGDWTLTEFSRRGLERRTGTLQLEH